MAAALRDSLYFYATDDDFNDTGSVYIAQFNPSSLQLALEIERNKTQAIGNAYTVGSYKYVKPQDVKFDFTLDGTNAAKPLTNGDIPSEIDAFLGVLYDINGSEHMPNYVKVLFGNVMIKGVATHIDVTYTLFRYDGMPLRAKVSVTVACTKSATLGEIQQDLQSPDLTHKVITAQSDRLISLAYGIYNNNGHYSDVADVNGFNNFRRLPVETAIFFPPLDKLSNNGQ